MRLARRLAAARAAARRGSDAGGAVVEFVVLGVVLLLPLTYVIVAVFRVQAASYGVAAASRDAGRAFVASESSSEAPDRARTAAAIVLADQHIELRDGDLDLGCTANPCLTPGASVTVRIGTTVDLPLLPSVLGGALPPISVEATHLEVVDPYAELRP